MADAEAFGRDLIVLAPSHVAGGWTWWALSGGEAGPARDDPLPLPVPGGRLTLLVPAPLAPVRDLPLPDMPLAQALAAARLSAQPSAFENASAHVAVAAGGDRLLQARVSPADMERWLADLGAMGHDPAALVPAALLLPRPDAGIVLGELAGHRLARTQEAAFAGEDALLGALAGPEPARVMEPDALMQALAAVHQAPPLNLRQGAYATRRASFFRVAEWCALVRMAACAALIALAAMLVWIVRLNHAADMADAQALAQVQKRFPAATDIAGAERIVTAEQVRRGAGANCLSAQLAALLQAMRGAPGMSVRNMGYGADGTLRFTAAAPRPDDINAVLLALQQAGWKVTVPPVLAPDPTGATVAAITVRAP